MAEVRQDDTVFIYALVCPRIGRVRYVGKTVRPQRRLYEHCTDSSDNPHKRRWIAKLHALGMEPSFVVLEECPTALWRERERWWELQFRAQGEPLTNIAECGYGPMLSLVKTWEGMIAPDGTRMPPITNMSAFCKKHGMNRAAVGRLFKGAVDSHHGWRCIHPDAIAGRQRRLEQRATDRSRIARESALARRPMFTIHGVTRSLAEWADEVGMDPDSLRSRLKKGMSVEKAILTPKNPKPPFKLVTALGQTKTRQEWAKEIGLSVGALNHRLKIGWDPEKAVTTPPGGR